MCGRHQRVVGFIGGPRPSLSVGTLWLLMCCEVQNRSADQENRGMSEKMNSLFTFYKRQRLMMTKIEKLKQRTDRIMLGMHTHKVRGN
jgi:hypothetical protein